MDKANFREIKSSVLSRKKAYSVGVVWEELVPTPKLLVPPQTHLKAKSILKGCV